MSSGISSCYFKISSSESKTEICLIQHQHLKLNMQNLIDQNVKVVNQQLKKIIFVLQLWFNLQNLTEKSVKNNKKKRKLLIS